MRVLLPERNPHEIKLQELRAEGSSEDHQLTALKSRLIELSKQQRKLFAQHSNKPQMINTSKAKNCQCVKSPDCMLGDFPFGS